MQRNIAKASRDNRRKKGFFVEQVHEDTLPKARKLLQRGKPEQIVVSGKKAIALVGRYNIEPKECIIDFKLQWGGWKYPVWNGRYTGRAGFLKSMMAKYTKAPPAKRGTHFFQCAEQFFSLMDEDDRLFEWLGEGTHPLQIIRIAINGQKALWPAGRRGRKCRG